MQYVQYSMITRSINLEDSAKNNYALSKPYRSRKKPKENPHSLIEFQRLMTTIMKTALTAQGRPRFFNLHSTLTAPHFK